MSRHEDFESGAAREEEDHLTARANIAILVALSGCDYVLGLERNVDVDAMPTEDVVDAPMLRFCLEDSFEADELDDTKWSFISVMGAKVSTRPDLVFEFDGAAQADNPAKVRSRAVLDLRDGEIEALITTRPPVGIDTSIAIVRGDDILYELRVTANQNTQALQYFVDDVPAGSDAIAGNFVHIELDGDQVRFGSGNTPGSYRDTTVPASRAVEEVSVQISAVPRFPINAGGLALTSWDFIRASCR